MFFELWESVFSKAICFWQGHDQDQWGVFFPWFGPTVKTFADATYHLPAPKSGYLDPVAVYRMKILTELSCPHDIVDFTTSHFLELSTVLVCPAAKCAQGHWKPTLHLRYDHRQKSARSELEIVRGPRGVTRTSSPRVSRAGGEEAGVACATVPAKDLYGLAAEKDHPDWGGNRSVAVVSVLPARTDRGI